MTDTSLSDRLRARADYLGTIMSGDPPVQLDAESPLLLRAAANTIDYLAPFQAALRLLGFPFQAALRLRGFGDEYCASADPIDYAKRWLAERLREDKARAEAERRLEETMTELNRICGLSFARISLAEAPRREEVEARLRRCGIEPDADLTGSVTLLLDKLEAAQHTNASLDLALRKRQATVDRQGNELGVLRTERKVCSSLGIELNNTLAIDDAVVATVAHRELAWRLQQAELKVRSLEARADLRVRPDELTNPPSAMAMIRELERADKYGVAKPQDRSIEVMPSSDPAALAALGMDNTGPLERMLGTGLPRRPAVLLPDGGFEPMESVRAYAARALAGLHQRADAGLGLLHDGERLAVSELALGEGITSATFHILAAGAEPPQGQGWSIYGPMTPELRATLPPMTLQDRAAAFVPVAVGETEVGPVTPGRQIRDAGELVAWLRDDGGPNDTAQIRLDRGRLVVDEIPPQPTVESGHGQTDASGRPCDCTPTCDVHLGEAEIDDAVGIMIPVLEDIAPDGTTTWGEAQIVTIEAQAKDSVET